MDIFIGFLMLVCALVAAIQIFSLTKTSTRKQKFGVFCDVFCCVGIFTMLAIFLL